MSIAINVDKVNEVLLPDGWHRVAWTNNISTFELDSYEYVGGPDHRQNYEVFLGGGSEPLIPATGFVFQEAEPGWIAGPLTAILAVRYAK